MAKEHAREAVPSEAERMRLAAALQTLDPAAPPCAVAVCGAWLETARRLVALPGSFNPPHAAHVALLRAGIEAVATANPIGITAGAYVSSVRTVDKEHVSGIPLADRLWLLCRLLETPAAAVVATNRGLYVEQAAALSDLCPYLEELVFVVGFDKIVQIFDARYYADRDAALGDLFGRARFLVAPRDEHTATEVAELLERPENRPFAAVATLSIDPALAHLSSTLARTQALHRRLPANLVPPIVARYVEATACFRDVQ